MTSAAPATTTSSTPAGTGRRWTRETVAQVAVMAAVVVGLHVAGWGTLVGVIVPQHLAVSSTEVFGVGLGLTAYLLGVRHAFDADHIAAIDVTTRKLVDDGRRPISVGFWFSLGHSSVVLGMCLLLALGVRAATGLVDDDSAVRDLLGVFGAAVSGTFLWALGLVNLLMLFRAVGQFRRARRTGEAITHEHTSLTGPMTRLLRPVLRGVTRPWHMYPVGLLFGLGFDTATEISLLVLAAAGAAGALPWYAILTLPILFAAGMSLFDAIDSVAMNHAYRWAADEPVRRAYYNVTITGLSAVIALGVGSITLAGLLGERLHLDSGPVAWLGAIEMEYVGFGVVAVLLAAWGLSVAVWRLSSARRGRPRAGT